MLRRAGFGATTSEINALTPLDLPAIVDHVLDFSGNPSDAAPAFMSNPGLGDWEKVFDLQNWWIDRMRTSPAPLQEKLALFWHGHLVSSNDKVNSAQLMYEQNHLFRAMGAGGFEALVQAVIFHAAMIIYLDNDPNVVGAPNENLARELMELFTLGVNQYTQDDVVAAARALTGHNLLDSDSTQYHFYAARHDNGLKTFMGVTQNWDGPDIVHYILTVDPHRTTAARYIAKKLWSFFAYPNPETAVLDALTAAFVGSDLDVGTLLRAIFLRPEFYASSRGALVRSPTEFVVAGLKAYGLTADATNPPWFTDTMGQHLLYPPNVAGWKQNAYWISTTATWARADFARYLTWVKHDTTDLLVETDPMTVPDAVQAAFDLFMIDSPSAADRAKLESWLTAQRATHEWADWGHLNLSTLLMLTPDFQLA